MLTHREVWSREVASGVIPFGAEDLSQGLDGSVALIVNVDPIKAYITHDFNAFRGPRIAIKVTEMYLGAAIPKLEALKAEGFIIYASEVSDGSVFIGGYKEVFLEKSVKMEAIPEANV